MYAVRTGRVHDGYMLIAQAISIFLAGLLAGEELIVRYGVHPALLALDDPTQVRARQSLIMKLRVIVPVIFFSTLAASIVALVIGGTEGGFGVRLAGVLVLGVWLVTTFGGTVLINQAALAWLPDSPPEEWKETITRWGRIDVVRSSAAIAAFACFVIAAAL